jgi:hypothetical protein
MNAVQVADFNVTASPDQRSRPARFPGALAREIGPAGGRGGEKVKPADWKHPQKMLPLPSLYKMFLVFPDDPALLVSSTTGNLPVPSERGHLARIGTKKRAGRPRSDKCRSAGILPALVRRSGRDARAPTVGPPSRSGLEALHGAASACRLILPPSGTSIRERRSRRDARAPTREAGGTPAFRQRAGKMPALRQMPERGHLARFFCRGACPPVPTLPPACAGRRRRARPLRD